MIAGDIPSHYYGKHPHQEVNLHSDGDQFEIYRPFVKRAWRVESPELFPEILEKAFQLAESGQPGPVLVDVPMDIFSKEVDVERFDRLKYNTKTLAKPDLDVEVATWIVRAAAGATGREVNLDLPGEVTGLTLVFVAAGSATVQGADSVAIVVGPGDAITGFGQEISLAAGPSPDLRLVLFRISDRAQALRERTPAEIERLKALGPAIITRRLVRPAHDDRPVNFLRDEDEAPI